MKIDRNLILLYIIILFFCFRGLTKPVLNYKSSNNNRLQDKKNIRLQNKRSNFEEPSTPLFVEDSILLEDNIGSIQAPVNELNEDDNVKSKEKIHESNIIENNSQDTIVNDLEVPYLNDTLIKEDYFPLNNVSNQTNELVDMVLKNIINCYNYSNGRAPTGNFPINLFFGSNISVFNYIFLPLNRKGDSDFTQIESGSTTATASAEQTEVKETTEVNQATEVNNETTEVSGAIEGNETTEESETTEINESVDNVTTEPTASDLESTTAPLTSLETNLDNASTESMPAGEPTEELTNTGSTEFTTLDESEVSETDSMETICITVQSVPVVIANSNILKANLQFTESALNATAVTPNSNAVSSNVKNMNTDLISAKTAAVTVVASPVGASDMKKNKNLKQKSGQVTVKNMKSVKKKLTKSMTRTKKHNTVDLNIQDDV